MARRCAETEGAGSAAWERRLTPRRRLSRGAWRWRSRRQDQAHVIEVSRRAACAPTNAGSLRGRRSACRALAPDELHAQVVARYQEPQRHYHGAAPDNASSAAELRATPHSAEVEIALVPRRGLRYPRADNEALSADLPAMRWGSVSRWNPRRISDLILFTRHAVELVGAMPGAGRRRSVDPGATPPLR